MLTTQAQFQLIVDPSVLEQLEQEAKRSRKEGQERCGFLLGTKHKGRIEVFAITAPGPQATLQAAHCEPDYKHAAQVLAGLQEMYQHLSIVGGWHTHLGYGDHLSSGDKETLFRAHARNPEFVALLINIRSDNQMTINLYVLSSGELKQCAYTLAAVTPQPRLNRHIHREVRSDRFARTERLLSHAILSEKRILIVGLGSGGSTVATFLARSGVYHFSLVDHETLQDVNVVRHIGLPRDIGRKKVEIVKEKILEISSLAKVQALDFDVLADADRFRGLIREHDLVLACTGHPQINNLTNRLALEEKKSAVYAGVYPKGVGGFILQVIPGKTACFNCMYNLTKESYPTDSDTLLRQTSQRYGFKEEELQAQQGLYVDIGFVALLLAKTALVTLLRGSRHQAGEWPGTLIVWGARDLTLHRGTLEREKIARCVTLPDGWLEEKQLQAHKDKDRQAQPTIQPRSLWKLLASLWFLRWFMKLLGRIKR